jgi:hypothetical protein
MIRVRDSWLLEDVQSFDDPTDWSALPEIRALSSRDAQEDTGFRQLLDDPEACCAWSSR